MQYTALPDHVHNSSAGTAAAAHVRRVAGWAAFLGAQCGLGSAALELIRKAVYRHHGPGLDWSRLSLQRLLLEIEPNQAPPARGSSLPLSADLPWGLVFGEFGVGRSGPHPLGLMCRIAEIAHAFDEALEAVSYGETTSSEIIAELGTLFPDSESSAILSKIPGRVPLKQRDLNALAERLPISQTAAADLWRLAANQDPQLRLLEDLASSDAVLAGLLVQAANVAEFALRSPISTVRKAVLHIGIPKARKILIAALLRPVFGSGGAQQSLWNHSLDSVQASDTVCDLAGISRREEVFLASLMHDIGRAALLAGNDGPSRAYAELIAEVAEVTTVEQFLFGQDHGSIGATILEGWKFPESLCCAVREHHDPEMNDSALAPVLYLVEYVTESGEDLPSSVRLASSARALGISMSDLFRCVVEPAASWNVLRYAA